MHQDIDFKSFSNIAIKGILIQSLIKPIQTNISGVKILLIEYLLRKVNKHHKHPLLHDIEIKRECHPHHDISIHLSLQKGCE